MLVFSRKKDDAIVIGSDIEIKIISIGRDTVKIGINAPRHVTIHRKEIYLAIEEENRKAAAKSINASQLDLIKSLVKKKK
ncbi:carbon storage regulator CsrA [Sulfidibacter corallicola]|uniref:Translational regulator CsrA n=1 Tax=Sulfidibacter corallicola TaxID=2818388 RepID=A0A8A4TWW0_SULCO|nr:carbon storage regulator CsrA [Sulfidibacter corallicola]QTD51005.1 carbon storage regulator CsrA [Sulfidibacter corallicola]